MAHIGDTLASKSLTVTQDLINQYAHICGDYNTLHVDVDGDYLERRRASLYSTMARVGSDHSPISI